MNISHYYIEKGTGYPLILLHGNGEDSSYFSNQISEFSLIYHVFAIDTRGHGKTDRGNAPFTIRQFADDLLEFMDSHNIDIANILGFSDGANIAMVFAIKYPEKVNKLILNGGNLNSEGIKWTVQLPIEIGYKIATTFSNKSLQARKNAEMLNLMVNEPNIAIDDLAKIQADTLVIAGTKDMVKEKHTRLIAKNISNAKLQLIKGNHFIANKNPVEFNNAVSDFLGTKFSRIEG
ncbi:MAG: alpha/beta hydrolase [Ruminococcus sp.]|nr:alpha/beta hydrolase [Ruminococcus sp.]